MPAPVYDVIILGLGAMGSAAAFHLAQRGRRVLGLDRHRPPHNQGSSHGESRIIREAYFEHPAYVPIVQRAYELWAELEEAAERKLFRQTGGVMLGRPEGAVISGSVESAQRHRLVHQRLDFAELRRRFPMLHPAEDMAGVWEPRAGILFPEACVAAHLDQANQHGATLCTEEEVLRWDAGVSSVAVTTARHRYEGAALILSAGAWLPRLAPDLEFPLTVERQVLFWFQPVDAAAFHPDRCPIYLWEYEPGRYFYGFPDLGNGVKIARHHEGECVSPETVRRTVDPSEVESMRQLAGRFLPGAAGPLRAAVVCLYTNTPDGHFLIDWHPARPRVLVASPCSGHGFKFSSAIGEILADLICERHARFDLDLFRLIPSRTKK